MRKNSKSLDRPASNFSSQAQSASSRDKSSPLAFSFGEPETALANNMGDYLGIFANGDYYEPPISQAGLVKLTRANAHHGTIPHFRKNQLVKHYIANTVLPAEHLENAAFEFEVLGHCYFKRITNRLKQTLRFEHLPALNMRRMKKRNRFCLLRNGQKPLEFKKGEVVQLKKYDINQQIYGVPEYLGGLQSVLLNEDATLFRRKYFNNGAHMGYIFYTADAGMSVKDEESIKTQIKQSKGVGNFRSMFINIPGGKKDSVQIIPVGDIATRDEFERVKNLTRNDVLSMWRIQPALAGVMPDNVGGFGDIEKISKVYFDNEVAPLQKVFMRLNDHLAPHLHIAFESPAGE